MAAEPVAGTGDGLEVEHVSVAFDGTPAVDDVSLALPAGEVLAVLGPSGCGKSTLLRVVAGLQRPDRGTVTFDGQDLTGVPTHRRGFALMFQDGQLFQHLSVAGNVEYALRRRRVPRAQARDRVADLLDLVGLPGLQDRQPATLSGGQQQRVALARALAGRPRLLLLDEPLSSLDRALRDRLGADLRRIITASGTTALLVTHDHEEAFTVADRMAVMRAGRIVQQGVTADVWRRPHDAETAEFLGYTTVLEGEAASAVVPGARRVALRPLAWRVQPDGDHTGTVTAAAQGADVVRLRVDIAGIGAVDAVGSLRELPDAGDRVPLALDPVGVAVLEGDDQLDDDA
ncbi:ABC transporter ATP-binding protein [Luteipulveratus sp. YIM 133132]|uniref:ABC transporter ATP-binding protein n=1 Tax=Luteipulveratus flavus TaxID=3031728 RepID=UPI0023AEFFF2|nr:ABC transporter ATP-binding protein [Luteipulveratus sp. YIM 133132]MDE9364889.1 ABC transporter ATP-binding protein [Luteipulveratus sp. YIM 133132]